MMQYLAFVLFLIALVFFWIARRQQQRSGLPGGRVVYADTRTWGAVEKPLYDAALGLTGKPDYLVEQAGQIIPVEVKSKRVGDAPYDSHIYQLAVYCLLVQEKYDKRPSYGLLHYPNRTYAIDYTPALEKAVRDLLDEIHTQEQSKRVNRSHQSPGRCSGCGFRSICDQKL